MFGIDKLLGYSSEAKTTAPIDELDEEEEVFQEHFYKTAVKLLMSTEKENIHGTLLITTSQIMFDPDQKDVTVLRNGVEKYGMMCNFLIVDHITLYSCHVTPSTTSKFICISLRRAMTRTFSKSEDKHPATTGTTTATTNNNNCGDDDDLSSSGGKTKKTWFEVPNDKVQDIFTFLTQSTHLKNDAQQPAFTVSSNTDEIGEELEKLSLHSCSSARMEWQVKRKSVDEKTETVAEADNNDEKKRTLSAGSSTTSSNSYVMTDLKKDADHVNEDEREEERLTTTVVTSPSDDEDDEVPELIGTSELLTEKMIKKLDAQLPSVAIGYPWELLYSTFEHGMSLKTLYRRVNNSHCDKRPVIIVIKDQNQHIFGGYFTTQPYISEHFYGTGESFLFQLSPHINFYKWTGENDFFLKGNLDSVIFGGGDGHIGLWLDERLMEGRSQPCVTFNNPMLSSTGDFKIHGVEIWSFKTS